MQSGNLKDWKDLGEELRLALIRSKVFSFQPWHPYIYYACTATGDYKESCTGCMSFILVRCCSIFMASSTVVLLYFIFLFFTGYSLAVQSIGSLQKKYSIGSFELLSKTAPIQAISLLVFGPFIDYYLNGQYISNYKLSSGAVVFILLSCSLAVFCNVSQYLCIGRFSAVSFQVLGHMKTVCVLTLGWLLFDSELTLKNILGMAIAVLGMVLYSWGVEIEKQANIAKTSHMKESLTEEDIRLLKDGVENTTVKDLELAKPKSENPL